MPNWIEGTLKIRGTYQDKMRFFNECVKENGLGSGYFNISSDEWGSEIAFKGEPWVKDSNRAFILDQEIAVGGKKDNKVEVTCLEIKQAWSFDEEGWSKVSRDYNIDIRFYRFEQGMEFCKEVEIIEGKVTLLNQINYLDWDWECPCPRKGG